MRVSLPSSSFDDAALDLEASSDSAPDLRPSADSALDFGASGASALADVLAAGGFSSEVEASFEAEEVEEEEGSPLAADG